MGDLRSDRRLPAVLTLAEKQIGLKRKGNRPQWAQKHTHMKLSSPFIITPRLAPGLKLGNAYLSFDKGQFVIDLPDGAEYVATDFRFPRCRIAGQTDGDVLASGFSAMLGFLSACAESRRYRNAWGEMGENANLFPENVGQWAEDNSSEIEMLSFELSEASGLIEA